MKGGNLVCDLNLEDSTADLESAVSNVDFETETETLPDAHFDAEIIKEANQRVIDYLNMIRKKIKDKNYKMARVLTAQGCDYF